MNDVVSVLTQGLYALPGLVTLVVGLVLINARVSPTARRRRMLGLAGCGVLLFESVVNLGYILSLPHLFSVSGFGFGYQLFAGLMSVTQTVLYCVGVGLLIGAVVTRSDQ